MFKQLANSFYWAFSVLIFTIVISIVPGLLHMLAVFLIQVTEFLMNFVFKLGWFYYAICFVFAIIIKNVFYTEK